MFRRSRPILTLALAGALSPLPAVADGWVPPPDGACVQPRVDADGITVIIEGTHLDGVRGARVAGERAVIQDQGEQHLVLHTPRGDAAALAGAVVLESAAGDQPVGPGLQVTGLPFIRGDVDEDGQVDRADADLLAAWLAGEALYLTCQPAADVNGDGAVDTADLKRLRRYLRWGRETPAAPFPLPGLPDEPAAACGLGAPPVVEGLFGPDGMPLSSRTVLREGDLVELRGERLLTGTGAHYGFGDVSAELLPFGDDTSVTLRVGPVGSDGERCPSLFESTDADPRADGAFGVARAVHPDTLARQVCAQFAASASVVGQGVWSADDGTLRLPVPADRIDPMLGVRARINLTRPALSGGADRGARWVEVEAHALGDRPTYAALLADLAHKVTRSLNGGRSPAACDTPDWIATADAARGELMIHPGPGGLPPGLPPPPPPQESQLAPMVPPLTGGNGTIQAIQPSCEDVGVNSPARLRAWCAFVQATRTSPLGLPWFESGIPQSAWRDGLNAINNLPHPADRSVSDKRTMMNANAWTDAQSNGYLSACAKAARVSYCIGGLSDWMPPFGLSSHIYKGFWRPYHKLPASLDASTLYSYDPPDGPRQYLVGLHISVSRGNISTYWHWATFWIPRGTDTLSKDGQPLSLTYNGACSTGDFQDQPQEVQGIWGNYVMCVNGESGGTQCGNPWGPLDECTQVSCRDCHLAGAVDFPGVTPLGELSTAWMFTLTDAAAVKACYEEIEAGRANGQTPYINLAPQECLD
ncbi:MAG: hypothetical protein H6702_14885 [Myxococcales bacterium]|nr:hypothetical protein [Myxococcales bacterium]